MPPTGRPNCGQTGSIWGLRVRMVRVHAQAGPLVMTQETPSPQLPRGSDFPLSPASRPLLHPHRGKPRKLGVGYSPSNPLSLQPVSHSQCSPRHSTVTVRTAASHMCSPRPQPGVQGWGRAVPVVDGAREWGTCLVSQQVTTITTWPDVGLSSLLTSAVSAARHRGRGRSIYILLRELLSQPQPQQPQPKGREAAMPTPAPAAPPLTIQHHAPAVHSTLLSVLGTTYSHPRPLGQEPGDPTAPVRFRWSPLGPHLFSFLLSTQSSWTHLHTCRSFLGIKAQLKCPLLLQAALPEPLEPGLLSLSRHQVQAAGLTAGMPQARRDMQRCPDCATPTSVNTLCAHWQHHLWRSRF